jgi:hypothetical protein
LTGRSEPVEASVEQIQKFAHCLKRPSDQQRNRRFVIDAS